MNILKKVLFNRVINSNVIKTFGRKLKSSSNSNEENSTNTMIKETVYSVNTEIKNPKITNEFNEIKAQSNERKDKNEKRKNEDLLNSMDDYLDKKKRIDLKEKSKGGNDQNKYQSVKKDDRIKLNEEKLDLNIEQKIREKNKRKDFDTYSEKPSRERSEFGKDRNDRYDKFDKFNKNDKYEKNNRYEKNDRYDKNDRFEKKDRYEKNDRYGKNDRYEKNDRFEKKDKFDREDRRERDNTFSKNIKSKSNFNKNNEDDFHRKEYKEFRNNLSERSISKSVQIEADINTNQTSIQENKTSKFVAKKENQGKTKPDEKFIFQKETAENPNSVFSNFDFLYGTHVIKAALYHKIRKLSELFVLVNFKENDSLSQDIKDIISKAKENNIEISYYTKDKLDKLTGGKPHNGVVLKAEKKNYTPITFTSLIDQLNHQQGDKQSGKIILLIDKIIDPQNFASILRTAYFLGVDAIVVNKQYQHPLTSLISKISSGIVECHELYSESNFDKFIKEAKKNDFEILSSVIEYDKDVILKGKFEEGLESDPLVNETNLAFPDKVEINNIQLKENQNTLIIFNSDYSQYKKNPTYNGYVSKSIIIQPKISEGMKGELSKNIETVDSLNVGVSAGVILNHVVSLVKWNKNNKI